MQTIFLKKTISLSLIFIVAATVVALKINKRCPKNNSIEGFCPCELIKASQTNAAQHVTAENRPTSQQSDE